jgi:hypothetical protein
LAINVQTRGNRSRAGPGGTAGGDFVQFGGRAAAAAAAAARRGRVTGDGRGDRG